MTEVSKFKHWNVLNLVVVFSQHNDRCLVFSQERPCSTLEERIELGVCSSPGTKVLQLSLQRVPFHLLTLEMVTQNTSTNYVS